MNKYLKYFKIGFLKSIEYKSSILLTFVSPFVIAVFFYFVWGYLYSLSGGLIGGFTYKEMIFYLIFGLIIHAIRSSELAEKICEEVKSGDIAIYLCRPVSFVKSVFAEGFGERIIQIFMVLVALIVITLVADLPIPNIQTLGILVLYLILFIIFDIVLYSIIGAFSFWFTEIWGIRRAIEHIQLVLTGRILPLSLFPLWFSSILKFTPFYYMEYSFASIYLGKFTMIQALFGVGMLTLWILILLAVLFIVYKIGFKKLEALGG